MERGLYDPGMIEGRVGALWAAIALATLAIAQGAIPVLVRADAPATHLVAGRVTIAAAVVWAAALLGETPAPVTWLGVGLVVVGGTIAVLEAADEEAIGAPATL